jgi:hypothetical protein
MDSLPRYRSSEEVFDFLDDYCLNRKEEIDLKKLGRDVGLVKSYMLETRPDDIGSPADPDLPGILQSAGWDVVPIEVGQLYLLKADDTPVGYVEPLSSRYAVVHTVRDSRTSDHTLQTGVRKTALLDFVWLAGESFKVLWEVFVLGQPADRYVTMKFEHQALFDRYDADGDQQPSDGRDWYDDEVLEQRASIMAVTERIRRLDKMLPQLRDAHPAFNAIKMLRFPASDQPGGYEFWSWGKVTYRASSFRDGREQIRSITRLYEQVTRAIETLVWTRAERFNLRDADYTTLRGAPVVFLFQEALSPATFQNFIKATFEHGTGPLRLWGNPIWLGDNKVHVYGIDLHLWQRIYLEITRESMTAILPKGTCGNTVHRLLANLQHYVDPGVRLCIGDIWYPDLVRDVALGRRQHDRAV